MKLNILSTAFFLIFTQITAFAQLQYYYEDFDDYVAGVQLACQNPIDWTTWSNLPCDVLEDPFLSSVISVSLPNSLKIVSDNNLIKLLGNISSGRNHITFLSNIPNGKSGYFSLLSQFSPDPIELAVECYFEDGGVGRLEGIPDSPIPFTYTNNLWQLIWMVVDFEKDEAQLWIDYSLVHIWE